MLTHGASGSLPARPVVVAIPARDEAEEIGPCLLALAAQQETAIDAVVLCLNNCSDGSADVVRAMEPRLPFALHTIAVHLSKALACAGRARRIAMESAATLAGANGVLLTTDADARVRPDWVVANLDAIAEGAEAVAGRAEIEPEGAKLIPAHLHATDARECAYATVLDEIGALIDPDPSDPWPRHDEHAGASIAVTVAAYWRAGGMPATPIGEDRAFFDALRRIDARIRHAPGARVVVSARIVGRAPGGMADTMRRRVERPDPFLDERLEPAAGWLGRVRLRRRLRVEWAAGADPVSPRLPTLAARLGIPALRLAGLLTARYFGTAWAEIEAASPRLHQRVRVPLEALAIETARAGRIRDRIRHAASQAGTPLLDAAE
ncbi:MAG: glycosyltransferase family A protein [Acetobacteraceae bacterium]|jgi:Glycosyltransferase like family 2